MQATILVLYSCSGSQTKPAEDSFEGGNLDTPNEVSQVDEECAEGVTSFDGLEYSFWNGLRMETNTFSGDFWESTEFVNSSAVSAFYYNYVEVNKVKESCSDIEWAGDIESDCIENTTVTDSAQTLRICANTEYPSDSVQGAALSVAGSVEKVYKFFSSIEPSHDIPSLGIFILPKVNFEFSDSDKELSITDNASWALTENGNQLLIFYPMSVEADVITPFWGVPWIVSHEYGHHIFYYEMSEAVNDYFGGITASISHALSQTYKWPQVLSLTNDGDNNLFYYKAVNEGFADLIAYYTADNSSEEMTSVHCSFKYRDVSYGSFNDGRDKVFDDDYMNLIENTCQDVNYTGVHAVGSILGYYIDRSLKLAGIESSLIKGMKLFEIFKNYDALLAENLDTLRSEQVVSFLVESVINTLSESGEPSLEQCEIMNFTFAKDDSFNTVLSERFAECFSS